MKRFSSGLICGILITLLMSSLVAFADDAGGMKLIVDGQEIQCDVPPMVVDGRVMVPLRFVADALGADATWDSVLYAAIITSRHAEPVVVPEPVIEEEFVNSEEDTPEPIVEETTAPATASIGELIDFGQARVTVNGVSYSTQNGDFVAGDGEVFALISLDVWTESDPPTDLYWSANSFVRSVKTTDGHTVTQCFSTGDSMNILGGQSRTVTLAFTILDSDSLEEVGIINPLARFCEPTVVEF